VGDWQEAMKHGHGELLFHNGDHYNGEWEQDKACGHGLLIYANGNRYDGYWLDNKRHGQGRLDVPDGSYYEVTCSTKHMRTYTHTHTLCSSNPGPKTSNFYFMHARWTVFVVLTRARCQGEWNTGLRDGRGTLVLPSGDTVVGTWRQGVLTGPVDFVLNNRSPWIQPDF
jgi:hypothetical protein